ncbi:MAG: hypothetical protein IJC95_06230 [Clostridia bacterium]|nr:hypothetical protein [Clostridia bacterium]MBQ3057064.1 hypothetical protein [Clostridia bacterium]
MKMWKMLGCLVLLCAIICGCAALATEAKVEEPGTTNDGGNQGSNDPQDLVSGENENTPPVSGSVVVTPTYSEGLRFRSNGDGTCALAGIGTCTSSCILIPPTSPAGDTVTEILPYALKDSIVGAVEIPTTVKTLSAASFAGCERLCYVRVAAGSEWYSEYDGVLYSADGKTLIYCPSGRTAGELKLRASLVRIAAGAFAECKKLETVVFQGSTAAWHNVIVGDENDGLYAAGFRFSS